MKSSAELDKLLISINKKGYPAYKSLKGNYQFPGYILGIDHVQGDPFAAPSKLSIQVGKAQAGFPEEYYNTGYKKTALEDYLLRLVGKAVSKYTIPLSCERKLPYSYKDSWRLLFRRGKKRIYRKVWHGGRYRLH